MAVVRRNALFPFWLTRALLPMLRKVPGPVQVIFIGSVAGEMPLPTYTPYGASKAFVRQLVASVSQDERFRGSSNVSVAYANLSGVITNGYSGPESVFLPTAATFAKSFVARIGCGRRVYFPYIFHAFESWSTLLIPPSILDNLIIQKMAQVLSQQKAD